MSGSYDTIGSMDVRFSDGPTDLVTWIAADPGVMQRASHAVVVDGGTWLVDPVDAPAVRDHLAAMPPIAGVIQLLDRHNRDCALLADHFGAPLHRLPTDAIPDTPFQVISVRSSRRWTERALWWSDRRCLIVAEMLGTASYFRVPGKRVGVHPFARLSPPNVLSGFAAEHLLMGHGDAVHDPDAGALADAAIAHARSSSARWAWSLVTGSVRRTDRARPILIR